MLTSTDTHAVFGAKADGTRFRVSDNLTWGAAQLEWNRLDELRRAGYLPHVRFFEVRSTDDPKYADLPVNFTMLRCTLGGRGYKNEQKAAREAWRHAMGDRFHDRGRDAAGVRTGVQGRGGWFYYPNGTTAAQGLYGLVRVARQRNLMVRGCDGRFYVLDADVADRPTVENMKAAA